MNITHDISEAPMDRTITTGMRVYNRGDMANLPHWGHISAIGDTGYALYVEITVDADEPGMREPGSTYKVPAAMINHEDKGHGGTRIVTEAAYNAHRAEQLRPYIEASAKHAAREGRRQAPGDFDLSPLRDLWYTAYDRIAEED